MLERTKLPYVAFFSFGEKLPVMTEGTSDPESLGYAFATAASLIGSRFQDVEPILFGSPLAPNPAEFPLEIEAFQVESMARAKATAELTSVDQISDLLAKALVGVAWLSSSQPLSPLFSRRPGRLS